MIGTTLNGRFSLDKELGRGGMGAVYRATDQVLQRTVAIKVLKDRSGTEVGHKIRLEAQILARLSHDGIVRIHDFGESDGLYYFVMEEIVGSNFHQRMRKITLPDRLRVLAEVAEALDYAHHQGVIHRDVKPANVLTTSTDKAKLSDFGLSVLIEEQAHETATIRGTPTYMSPEQARGKRLDHRTDLYALGVMLYEVATGVPPFTGPALAVMAGHTTTPPERPSVKNPKLPADIETLILALLEKKPDSRPSSGASVAEELRRLMATEQLAAGLPQESASISQAISSQAPTNRLAPVKQEPTKATLVQSGTNQSVPASPSADKVPSLALAAARSGASISSRRPAEATLEIARGMVQDVIADPVVLTPDERYLTGHYLAYLLGGSRRTGFLGRRPLDALNGDRARLLLAMTWLSLQGADDENVATAARLLDDRPEIRPLLNPVIVTKYLAQRDTPSRRKRFRHTRRLLQQASRRATEHLTDTRGTLNPGLMPQLLEDLRKVAPAKTEIDDQLVSRWNRVAEAWQTRDDLRSSVLQYATSTGWRNPANLELWPEVIYPLIERARRHRQLRSVPEAILDHLCGALHIPDAGLRFDRAMVAHVPAQVVEKIDLAVDLMADEPVIGADAESGHAEPSDRFTGSGPISFHELTADIAPDRHFVRLVEPDPVRFSMDQLHLLWKEAVANLQAASPQARAAVRHVAVGPYRLTVVASIRGKSAGQVVLQGMPNHKQIEMLTPTLRVSSSRPTLAVWVYQDDSLVIAYNDFRNVVRYISWHAPTNVQTNYDDPADLNHDLLQFGLESPDQLSTVLTKKFKPKFVN